MALLNTALIDELLGRENFAPENWAARGLNPSDADTIARLEAATDGFLLALKSAAEQGDGNLRPAVEELVESLPWYDFDTEEKEFLAETLAPAIESVGLDPWTIF